MSPEVSLSSIFGHADRGNVRGLRVGETLTSAEHKKRNMANNLSETLNCTQPWWWVFRGRGGGSLQFPVELHGHIGRAHAGGETRWLRELSLHIKSEDERQDVGHGAEGQNLTPGSEIALICVSTACDGPMKASICYHCTSYSFGWAKLSKIITCDDNKKVLRWPLQVTTRRCMNHQMLFLCWVKVWIQSTLPRSESIKII